MVNGIAPMGVSGLEHLGDETFSEYTHPVLEDFIQRVITQNRDALSTVESQKLIREFFLYGLLRASGQDFLWYDDQIVPVRPEVDDGGLFNTNNGILAVSDFDGEFYIRGGDSYHGYSRFSEDRPEGVEGTLLSLGYDQKGIYVPHSNGDVFVDPQREKLFRALRYFSKNVRNLRGESTSGLIIKDLSEPEQSAPYKRRNPNLPRIVLNDTILIPGNREKTIKI